MPEYPESRCYEGEWTSTAQGIVFELPSRRRFIPFSWLLHAELNENATELHLHYTHSVVVVSGTKLAPVHDAIGRFQLCRLRELPPSALATAETTVSRIEITENVSG